MTRKDFVLLARLAADIYNLYRRDGELRFEEMLELFMDRLKTTNSHFNDEKFREEVERNVKKSGKF